MGRAPGVKSTRIEHSLRERLDLIRGFNKGLWALVILIAVCGIIPVFHYWYFIGRLPQVTPLEARQLLAGAGPDFVLVDVRSPAEFSEAHIAGAENWPASQIAGLQS